MEYLLLSCPRKNTQLYFCKKNIICFLLFVHHLKHLAENYLSLLCLWKRQDLEFWLRVQDVFLELLLHKTVKKSHEEVTRMGEDVKVHGNQDGFRFKKHDAILSLFTRGLFQLNSTRVTWNSTCVTKPCEMLMPTIIFLYDVCVLEWFINPVKNLM